MSHTPDFSRRRFLQASALAGAGALAAPISNLAAAEKSGYEFCTFTKAIQHLSYEEVAVEMARIGFDGVESAVRPGGHVEPEKVENDLPRMVDSLKKHQLNLTVMTTAINEVSDEQRTEAVLRTAAGLGTKRFRMGYYKYDLNKPIRPQLGDFRAKLKDLVAMTDEIGIKPVYQNHSGKNYFGGPIWDAIEVFEDFDPKQIGMAFDIGHATVEGAKAWPLNFATAFPYIDTVYVKEPGWDDNKLEFGPIGAGAVDKSFFRILKESSFDGPISLHVEYLGHKDPKMVPTVLKAMETDFATLKSYLS